ncbi:MAG: hypothetical protein IKI08_02630 [Selenomonadaceae bacterium]|nr:hypothetical protein [Selenomonadaceae bacterium]
MSDDKEEKKSRLNLLKDIAAFEVALALFDFFARVVREFFGILLTVIIGAAILVAIMHFIR